SDDGDDSFATLVHGSTITYGVFDLLIPKQYSQVMMSGYAITPDLKWYEEVTKRKGLNEPRCPFASTEKCPRYYQSLSILGTAGATAIDKAIDEKLQKRWEHHHLWPRTMEQETSVGGSEEDPHHDPLRDCDVSA